MTGIFAFFKPSQPHRTENVLLLLFLALSGTPALALSKLPQSDFGLMAQAKIFDVQTVTCQSGAKPKMDKVFVPGSLIQIRNDVLEAFAKAGDNRDAVLLKYPIAKEGLDESAPPPCEAGDTLLILMKKNQAMTTYTKKLAAELSEQNQRAGNTD